MRAVFMLMCLASVLFSASPAYAQTVRIPESAAYLGIGAYSTHHVDVFSVGANQAALAGLKVASGGVYGEKRFLLKELGLYNAVIAVPTHSGNFSLDARYFGFADYNETELGLAYARALGNKINVGIQFNYYSVQIAGYGNASSMYVEIAAILHLTDQLNAGFHVCNPTGSKLDGNREERLSSLYTVGIGFEPSENFLFTAEVNKEENKPANVTAGFQYKFLYQLLARLSVSAIPSSMCLGFGFIWRSMRFDAMANYHSQLGVTPGIVIMVPVSSKEMSRHKEK